MRRRLGVAVGGLLTLAATAGAQVGHLPATSPYRDLEYTQELSLIAGSFIANKDPARVAPQSGPIFGARYDWRIGGPASLVGEFAGIPSRRNVINPLAAGAARDLGTRTRMLYTGNVGLGLSLTGAKSWHSIVPVVSGGLGFISDFRSKADSGGFKFGTRFALNGGAGIRWVPGGRWAARLYVMDRLYTIAYPESFYVAPTGGTAVVTAQQARSFWTHNPTFTLGISRLF